MTGSLRERRRLLLREEILETARAIAAEKGFFGLVMDDLAARVGISKPTLYSFFETREALVHAAMLAELDRVLALVDTPRESRSPLAHVRFVLETILQRQLLEGPAVVRPLLPEFIRLVHESPVLRERFALIFSTMAQRISDAIESGEIDPALDPMSLVHLMHGMSMTLLVARARQGSDADLAQLVHTLVRVFERGVRFDR